MQLCQYRILPHPQTAAKLYPLKVLPPLSLKFRPISSFRASNIREQTWSLCWRMSSHKPSFALLTAHTPQTGGQGGQRRMDNAGEGKWMKCLVRNIILPASILSLPQISIQIIFDIAKFRGFLQYIALNNPPIKPIIILYCSRE